MEYVLVRITVAWSAWMMAAGPLKCSIYSTHHLISSKRAPWMCTLWRGRNSELIALSKWWRHVCQPWTTLAAWLNFPVSDCSCILVTWCIWWKLCKVFNGTELLRGKRYFSVGRDTCMVFKSIYISRKIMSPMTTHWRQCLMHLSQNANMCSPVTDSKVLQWARVRNSHCFLLCLTSK